MDEDWDEDYGDEDDNSAPFSEEVREPEPEER